MIEKWNRFRWDFSPPFEAGAETLAPYVFRHAVADDEAVVARVVLSAFSQDSAWSEDGRAIIESLSEKCGEAFESDPPLAVVVQHGSRIIGASVVTIAPDAENHLLTGPCILHEYRSRGIGSILLLASLSFLRDQGLAFAYGVAPAISPAAKYVYPKVGGQVEPFRVAPEAKAEA